MSHEQSANLLLLYCYTRHKLFRCKVCQILGNCTYAQVVEQKKLFHLIMKPFQTPIEIHWSQLGSKFSIFIVDITANSHQCHELALFKLVYVLYSPGVHIARRYLDGSSASSFSSCIWENGINTK